MAISKYIGCTLAVLLAQSAFAQAWIEYTNREDLFLSIFLPNRKSMKLIGRPSMARYFRDENTVQTMVTANIQSLLLITQMR